MSAALDKDRGLVSERDKDLSIREREREKIQKIREIERVNKVR